LRFRFSGSGFRVSTGGLGFRVPGFGCRVSSLVFHFSFFVSRVPRRRLERPLLPSLRVMSLTCEARGGAAFRGLGGREGGRGARDFHHYFLAPLAAGRRPCGWGRCKAIWKREFKGARPVHQIFTMLKWIRTSRLSTKKSLSEVPVMFTTTFLPHAPQAGGPAFAVWG